MSLIQWTGLGVIALIGVYLVARLIFSAYFLTKQQHEGKKHQHG